MKIKRLICYDRFVYFYHLCYTKQLRSPTAQMHEISNALTKQKKSSDKYTSITKWLIIDNFFKFLDNKFNAKRDTNEFEILETWKWYLSKGCFYTNHLNTIKCIHFFSEEGKCKINSSYKYLAVLKQLSVKKCIVQRKLGPQTKNLPKIKTTKRTIMPKKG